MKSANINNEKQQLIKNRSILYFFLKLLALVSAWFVFYNLILKPGRTIDRPLTNFITNAAANVINRVSPNTPSLSWYEEPVHKDKNFLIKQDKRVLGIHDACNGIDLMFIYIGIIVLLPYSARRKFFFGIGGIAAIILANIIRVCSLYYIYRYHTAAFDVSHHYVFTILMYVLIFYGWLLFIKKDKPNGQSS
jgi:exosortase/archaeosortase family protein